MKEFKRIEKAMKEFKRINQQRLSRVDRANALAKVIGLHENYYETLEEATDAALNRSLSTHRTIYIFLHENLFMVCAHGVERIGYTLVRRCQHGSIL